MRTVITEMFGVELPIFAFSHCRDVVAAVTNAGGVGVFGGTRFSPEELEKELTWIDEQVGDKPYGVDLLMPYKQSGLEHSPEELRALIPDTHVEFVDEMLHRYGVLGDDSSGYDVADWRGSATRPENVAALIDVALQHPIRLLVSALGPPAPEVMARCKERDIIVGALAGTVRHARRNIEAGADFIVATGYEAGGHTGEVGTMVLTAEVAAAVAPVPVLSAGGIATGRQVVAALALGAAGVWTGSVWLQTAESEVDETVKAKMAQASSSDTLRSKTRTGKPARQLRSAWHDEWDAHPEVQPLQMPFQGMISENAFEQISRAADAGNERAKELDSYYVGQAVGLMPGTRRVADVIHEMLADMVDAYEAVGESVSN
ncbi:MAG TPA: nitronate monooxygenase [Streptomyces sp.]|uniref:nitronate monooxygenase n=1 Tax=Streptomyces sp. TaxID=1931 RepID=UPI002B88E156|nr:nitronate monooxygenase [Streptomyces sp.]HWU07676.1 nitronate monooxygenase [Streptomyces sp.]